MEFEFEGRTEKEAIDRAAGELGLEKDDFDVEILETQKSGLFKKGLVRIKVHVGNFGTPSKKPVRSPEREYSGGGMERDRIGVSGKSSGSSQPVFGEPSPQNEFEEK